MIKSNKTEKSLICFLREDCEYYSRHLDLYEKGKAKIDEDPSKIIRVDKRGKYYCGALKTIYLYDKQKNINEKDCELIQLLNNTHTLLKLKNNLYTLLKYKKLLRKFFR